MEQTNLQGRDNAQYVRIQKGHSLVIWILLSVFLIIPAIWVIYFTISKNHYWHF